MEKDKFVRSALDWTLTEQECDLLLKSKSYAFIPPQAIERYREQVFLNAKRHPDQEEEILLKAKQELDSLLPIRVRLDDHRVVSFYIQRRKEEDLDEIQKAMKSASPAKKPSASSYKGPDESALREHASNTPTEHLEHFVGRGDNPSLHHQIASEELESRKMQNQEKVRAGEDEEFRAWLDGHLDAHDKEDLRGMAVELTMQHPAKLKDLKSHFRSQGKRGAKTDENGKEIDRDQQVAEWVEEYLTKLSLGDLKTYVKGILDDDPHAAEGLKGKFSSLKENKKI